MSQLLVISLLVIYMCPYFKGTRSNEIFLNTQTVTQKKKRKRKGEGGISPVSVIKSNFITFLLFRFLPFSGSLILKQCYGVV